MLENTPDRLTTSTYGIITNSQNRLCGYPKEINRMVRILRNVLEGQEMIYIHSLGRASHYYSESVGRSLQMEPAIGVSYLGPSCALMLASKASVICRDFSFRRFSISPMYNSCRSGFVSSKTFSSASSLMRFSTAKSIISLTVVRNQSP